jgi:hypothetical protein
MQKINKQFIQDFFSVEATIASLRACEEYASTIFNINKEKDLKPSVEKFVNVETFVENVYDQVSRDEPVEDIGTAEEEFWKQYEKYKNPTEAINDICVQLRQSGIETLLCFIYMERFYHSMHEKDNQKGFFVPKYRRPYVTVKDVYQLSQFTPSELMKMMEQYFSFYIERDMLLDQVEEKIEQKKNEGGSEKKEAMLFSEQMDFLKSQVSKFYNVQHEDFQRMPISEFFKLLNSTKIEVARKIENYGVRKQ